MNKSVPIALSKCTEVFIQDLITVASGIAAASTHKVRLLSTLVLFYTIIPHYFACPLCLGSCSRPSA